MGSDISAVCYFIFVRLWQNHRRVIAAPVSDYAVVGARACVSVAAALAVSSVCDCKSNLVFCACSDCSLCFFLSHGSVYWLRSDSVYRQLAGTLLCLLADFTVVLGGSFRCRLSRIGQFA